MTNLPTSLKANSVRLTGRYTNPLIEARATALPENIEKDLKTSLKYIKEQTEIVCHFENKAKSVQLS